MTQDNLADGIELLIGGSWAPLRKALDEANGGVTAWANKATEANRAAGKKAVDAAEEASKRKVAIYDRETKSLEAELAEQTAKVEAAAKKIVEIEAQRATKARAKRLEQAKAAAAEEARVAESLQKRLTDIQERGSKARQDLMAQEAKRAAAEQAKAAREAEQAKTNQRLQGERENQRGRQAMLAGAGAVATGAVAVGLGMGIREAVQAFSNFEGVLQQVRAVSGATNAEMQAMTAMALDLGVKTKFSARETAEGMSELTKAGMGVDQAMAALPGVLSMAAAGGVSVSDAAETAAAALNGFGLQAGEAGRVADIMAKAANLSAIGVGDLQLTMKYVAPVAAAASQSIEEMSAAIAIMGNSGIKGEQAGTTLRAVFARLIDPSQEAAQVIQRLGLHLVDTQGKMLPLVQIVDELRAKTATMTETQRNQSIATIFGQEALSGMLSLLKQSPEAYEAVRREMFNSAGAAKSMADVMNQGLGPAVEQMQGAIEGLAIVVGKEFSPAIKGGAAVVAGWAEWLSKAEPSTVKWAAALGAAAFAATGVAAALTAAAIPVAILGTGLAALGVTAGGVGLALGGLAAAAGVAAVGVGSYVLAAQRAEEASGATAQALMAEKAQVDALVAEYEALVSKSNKTNAERERQQKLLAEINKIMPGVVRMTTDGTKAIDLERGALQRANAERERELELRRSIAREKAQDLFRRSYEMDADMADLRGKASAAQASGNLPEYNRLMQEIRQMSMDSTRLFRQGQEVLRNVYVPATPEARAQVTPPRARAGAVFVAPQPTRSQRGPGLAPASRAHLLAATAELERMFPGARLSSDTRSSATQARLYAAYRRGQGPLAARPGTSAHEHGLGRDYVVPPADKAAFMAEARRRGLKVIDEGHVHTESVAHRAGLSDSLAISSHRALQRSAQQAMVQAARQQEAAAKGSPTARPGWGGVKFLGPTLGEMTSLSKSAAAGPMTDADQTERLKQAIAGRNEAMQNAVAANSAYSKSMGDVRRVNQAAQDGMTALMGLAAEVATNPTWQTLGAAVGRTLGNPQAFASVQAALGGLGKAFDLAATDAAGLGEELSASEVVGHQVKGGFEGIASGLAGAFGGLLANVNWVGMGVSALAALAPVLADSFDEAINGPKGIREALGVLRAELNTIQTQLSLGLLSAQDARSANAAAERGAVDKLVGEFGQMGGAAREAELKAQEALFQMMADRGDRMAVDALAGIRVQLGRFAALRGAIDTQIKRSAAADLEAKVGADVGAWLKDPRSAAQKIQSDLDKANAKTAQRAEIFGMSEAEVGTARLNDLTKALDETQAALDEVGRGTEAATDLTALEEWLITMIKGSRVAEELVSHYDAMESSARRRLDAEERLTKLTSLQAAAVDAQQAMKEASDARLEAEREIAALLREQAQQAKEIAGESIAVRQLTEAQSKAQRLADLEQRTADRMAGLRTRYETARAAEEAGIRAYYDRQADLQGMKGDAGAGPNFSAMMQAAMASIMATAPRFHSGGRVGGSGEVPAVLKAGEYDFTPDQLQRMVSSAYSMAPLAMPNAVAASRGAAQASAGGNTANITINLNGSSASPADLERTLDRLLSRYGFARR